MTHLAIIMAVIDLLHVIRSFAVSSISPALAYSCSPAHVTNAVRYTLYVPCLMRQLFRTLYY